jgi:hypothetical protein
VQQVCLDPAQFSPGIAGAAVVINDNSTSLSFDPHEQVLARELGHALFLGHGNGLDDDNDNLLDECCDNDEDPNAQPFSLMCPTCSNEDITPLQRSLARQIAARTLGTVIDPPLTLVPIDVVSDQRVDSRHDVEQLALDIVWVGMSENTSQEVTVFSLKLLGLIPEIAHFQYLIFVDLDENPETGGTPGDIGYETEFESADAIIDVVVVGAEEGKPTQIETLLWVAADGEWKEMSVDEVLTFVNTAIEVESQTPLFDGVNIQIPMKLIGGAGERVRIQAMAQDIENGERDVLPNPTESEYTILFMNPLEYPSCSVDPPTAEPGDIVTVEVFDLLPNQQVKVVLGDKTVAEAETNSEGQATIEFEIPVGAEEAVQLVTVGVVGTALTADCAAVIGQPSPTVTPTTSVDGPTIQITPGVAPTVGLDTTD